MRTHQEITLTHDCNAVQIPSGQPIVLPEGMTVVITQALGGSYTVATPAGLARLSEQDAKELGLITETPGATSAEGGEVTNDQVWEQLKNVYDPEIPVNVVDLGLIYDCEIKREDSGVSVHVKMTLTAPGCGMGETIAADARSKILSLGGVNDAQVELVWEPAWNQSMITDVGKMKLGLM